MAFQQPIKHSSDSENHFLLGNDHFFQGRILFSNGRIHFSHGRIHFSNESMRSPDGKSFSLMGDFCLPMEESISANGILIYPLGKVIFPNRKFNGAAASELAQANPGAANSKKQLILGPFGPCRRQPAYPAAGTNIADFACFFL